MFKVHDADFHRCCFNYDVAYQQRGGEATNTVIGWFGPFEVQQIREARSSNRRSNYAAASLSSPTPGFAGSSARFNNDRNNNRGSDYGGSRSRHHQSISAPATAPPSRSRTPPVLSRSGSRSRSRSPATSFGSLIRNNDLSHLVVSARNSSATVSPLGTSPSVSTLIYDSPDFSLISSRSSTPAHQVTLV